MVATLSTDPVELEHQRPYPMARQSFDGLNAFDTRFANNGNQLFASPASPSLAVGHGFVLQVVNTVLRVYDEGTGAPLTAVVDLNTFFGLPARANRSAPSFGPSIRDTRALYDAHTHRWFIVAISYEVDTVLQLGRPPNSRLRGPNYLELAESDSPDPTGELIKGFTQRCRCASSSVRPAQKCRATHATLTRAVATPSPAAWQVLGRTTASTA